MNTKLLPLLILLFCYTGNTIASQPYAGIKNQLNSDTNDPIIRYAGQQAELSVVQVTDLTYEIQLTPIGFDTESQAESDVLIQYPRKEIWKGRSVMDPVRESVGGLTLEVLHSPLRVIFKNGEGDIIQELFWPDDTGDMHFRTEASVFGLGHGGPQFDRRGEKFPMRDGWGAYERPTHGSRVSTPMIIGANGWSLFIHHPASQENSFDLRNENGIFKPGEEEAKLPLKLLITIWDEPSEVLSEYRVIAGETPMPPLWSLGYMQSHRTLESREQMLQVARNFRDRMLPADAVIYLGTGFTPAGWNRGHGSFEFNEEIFNNPEEIFSELNDLDFRVVLHTYSPPVGLFGSAVGEESDDEKHITNYWLDNHEAIFNMGVDGWWPDGGEPLSSESRVARYRMYWQGPLYSRPDVRPWNINRTGYSGAHRYGGWIWSGDPDSYWKTLKTQIEVGLNHVVSLTPFWGSDTGGFLPSKELTGELYIRWFQFSTFTTSFRGHGRAWHLRLPWGWNSAELGPAEVDNFSDAFEDGYPDINELRNALIEPIAREYLNLRYQMLTYNYTMIRETHDTGMPPMRAMWLHYPDDPNAVKLGDQYMWGRDMLIAPVYEKDAEHRILYLPEGKWYDFWTNEKFTGNREITRKVDLATLPIYIRAGSIIPIDPVRQYTSQEVDDPVTFQIYPGEDGVYRWYRDDGESQQYIDGNYSWTRLSWDNQNSRLTIEPDPESEGEANQTTNIRFKLMETGATGGKTKFLDWNGEKKVLDF